MRMIGKVGVVMMQGRKEKKDSGGQVKGAVRGRRKKEKILIRRKETGSCGRVSDYRL